VTRRRRQRARRREPSGLTVRDLTALRREVERSVRRASPRWNADPEDVRRSVAKLVLTLVEFLRKLFERQAIRRLEAGSLTTRETEALGVALMRLEKTIRELARHFDLDPDELNLDLGPLGRLH
jgi:Gas vesicle protein K